MTESGIGGRGGPSTACRPRVPCGHWYSSWAMHGPAAVGHAQRGLPGGGTRRRCSYQGKPEYFAQELSCLPVKGVRILGGCCGTTPQHIAALRAALDVSAGCATSGPGGYRFPPQRQSLTVETDDAFLRKLTHRTAGSSRWSWTPPRTPT
ncbi:MAG: homocysteine S-methyltransferase family protein [Faecalibacterium sp.]